MPSLDAMNEAWSIVADVLCAEPGGQKCMDNRHIPMAQEIISALDRAGWKLRPPRPKGFYVEKPAWWRRYEVSFCSGGDKTVVGRRWFANDAYKLRRRLGIWMGMGK